MVGLTLGQKMLAVFVTLLLNVLAFVFGGILGVLVLVPSVILLGHIVVRL